MSPAAGKRPLFSSLLFSSCDFSELHFLFTPSSPHPSSLPQEWVEMIPGNALAQLHGNNSTTTWPHSVPLQETEPPGPPPPLLQLVKLMMHRQNMLGFLLCTGGREAAAVFTCEWLQNECRMKAGLSNQRDQSLMISDRKLEQSSSNRREKHRERGGATTQTQSCTKGQRM